MWRVRITLVCLATSVAAGCGGESSSDSGSTAVATQSPTTSSTVIPSSIPSTEPTTDETRPPSTAEPLPPITFTGHGDFIIDLGPSNDRKIVRAQDNGTFFVVAALDQDGKMVDGNVIVAEPEGPFSGTQLMKVPPSDVRYLKVSSNGDWTVELLDQTAVDIVGDEFEGVGSSVVAYEGPGGTAEVTHEGTGIFIVLADDDGTYDLVVPNTLGPYSGTHEWPNGPVLIQITADGPWTVTVTE